MTIEESVFYDRTGFPGVIGCLDGTHVEIVKPKRHGEVNCLDVVKCCKHDYKWLKWCEPEMELVITVKAMIDLIIKAVLYICFRSTLTERKPIV